MSKRTETDCCGIPTICMSMVICLSFLVQVSIAELQNVALKKPTKQSSTYTDNSVFQCASDLANDGNMKGTDTHNILCASTEEGQNEWWTVNLQHLYDIMNIAIFGRTDCCIERLQDFDIDVIAPMLLSDDLSIDTMESGQKTFNYYREHITTELNINCPANTVGQFVRIRHRGRSFLTLCEVQVYGTLLQGRRWETPSCNAAELISKHFGFSGKRYQGTVIIKGSAKSIVHCMLLCKDVHCCYAVNFNKKKNQCDLTKMFELVIGLEFSNSPSWNTLLKN